MVLDEISALGYPSWLTDTAAYLPGLDLSCIATSGKSYLKDSIRKLAKATMTGFLRAMRNGCHDAIVLSGGYDNDKEELRINIVLEKNAGNNL